MITVIAATSTCKPQGLIIIAVQRGNTQFKDTKDMPPYHIYITEPDTIDITLVKEALGDTPYTLVLGSPDFTVGDCSSCDTAIIRSATRVDATVQTKMPLLKHVVRVGTGLDTVDLDFCEQAGISVHNAPGANADAVAEYAVTVILVALRKLHLLERADLDTWNRFKFTGQSVTGRTIGIVGFGNIGRLLYEKLRGLGCDNFLVYDPFVKTTPEHAQLVELPELLTKSDIISLHLPLLPETHHIIDASKIALLKAGAILLNASRGSIVNEAAVLQAMQSKQFTYIADTVEGEPKVNPNLLDQPNIIVTPHIASLTQDAEVAMVKMAVANLLASKQVPHAI